MTEEIVIVHSPKTERKQFFKNAPSEEVDLQREKNQQRKNGKPSRRWLAAEVDKIFERNVELMKQVELRKETERHLLDSKTRLERELALLKSQRVVGSHDNDAIRERNKQLSQDIFLMQNILVKLNFELERYQEKLRKYEENIPTTEKESGSQSAGDRKQSKRQWINGEITIFAPLLLAYEESLKEKDDLIRDLRSAIERLSAKMKEIVKENSEIRTKMSDSEKQGEVTYSDWLGVQRELSITMEQNHLLARQTKLGQSKISELKAVFHAKLSEVCSEKDELTSKLSHLHTDYLVLRGRSSALEQELDRLKKDYADRIPKSVHSAYIAECKRLLDELKSRHEEERTSLLRKIAVLESDSSKCQPVTSFLEKIRIIEQQLSESRERCAKAERRRDFFKGRLDALVAFSKELISEHESLLKGVNGELRINAGLIARIDQVKQQLKGVEHETLQQIKLLDENISTQVERVNQVKIEQNQEVQKLRDELERKEATIVELKEAAKKREEDIEMIWKAALSEKRNETPNITNTELNQIVNQ